jgi:hypothetical protein
VFYPFSYLDSHEMSPIVIPVSSVILCSFVVGVHLR